jgi:hypothetical protein
MNKQVVGKLLSRDNVHQLISKHIKSVLPVRVKKCIDPNILQGYIFTGGLYNSIEDKSHRTAIEINFSYHPQDEKLRMTNYMWRRLAYRFAEVILHEVIHMRQFRSRKFKTIPGYQSTAELRKERKQQEYYGDTDEMGAFSFNIACEMVERFGYDPRMISQYMDSNNARRRKNTRWHDVMTAFNWNHDHKIIRRVKQKILRQLENAYIGRPFKTNDWLTY